MLGLILWAPAESGGRFGRVTVEEGRVLGVPFLWARVPRGPRTTEERARRRAVAGARRLRRLGVRWIVPPEGAGGLPWAERAGVAAVSALPLRQSLAADLARGAMGPGGCPAVAGDRLTAEMARAVTELALRCRYVLLDVPAGGEELARRLRREYGVSLLLTPEGAPPPDALVLFAPRPEAEGRARTVLRLYDEAAPLPPLLLPPAMERQLPPGCDRPRLLSALMGEGALRPGQITVGCARTDAGAPDSRRGP